MAAAMFIVFVPSTNVVSMFILLATYNKMNNNKQLAYVPFASKEALKSLSSTGILPE